MNSKLSKVTDSILYTMGNIWFGEEYEETPQQKETLRTIIEYFLNREKQLYDSSNPVIEEVFYFLQDKKIIDSNESFIDYFKNDVNKKMSSFYTKEKLSWNNYQILFMYPPCPN